MLNRYGIFRVSIGMSFLLLIAYSVSITVMWARSNPEPLVIGVDSLGTRIITDQDDALIKKEKINFIREFITQMYSFDEVTYSERVSRAGDFMTQSMWDKKAPEFKGIQERMKSESIRQEARITEIREVDEKEIEVDLALSIQTRLKGADSKVRVSLTLKNAPRTLTKPYPYEVTNYEESLF